MAWIAWRVRCILSFSLPFFLSISSLLLQEKKNCFLAPPLSTRHQKMGIALSRTNLSFSFAPESMKCLLRDGAKTRAPLLARLDSLSGDRRVYDYAFSSRGLKRYACHGNTGREYTFFSGGK